MALTIRRRHVGLFTAVAAVTALGVILAWPVTTRQGVDYAVSTHQVPLYVKAAEFVSRSARYRALARAITAGAASDEGKTLAVFDWMRRNVREVPDGFPVIDDHILNIITRGYGVGDQQADVFATLTTYAGVPAFWSRVPADHGRPGVILSFAQVDGRWRVFDAARAVVFRAPNGALATLEDLQANPALIPAPVGASDVEGARYADVVSQASAPALPDPLRAELQMPLPRIWHELKTAIGVESDDEP